MRSRHRENQLMMTASPMARDNETPEPCWDCAVASVRQGDTVKHRENKQGVRRVHEAVRRPCLVNRAMVFADLADFSKVTDAQIPAFLDFFAEVIATAAVSMPLGAQVRACGDEVFAVMENACDVLRYALALNRTLAGSNFGDDPLQGPMRARIALHAGQIVLGSDPVTGLPSHYGRNVNLAARLERITEPGRVFATSDFISRLKQELALPCAELAPRTPGWGVTYLGTLCLPKNFGFQEVYEIREAGCPGQPD